jgi:hypothetical protein
MARTELGDDIEFHTADRQQFDDIAQDLGRRYHHGTDTTHGLPAFQLICKLCQAERFCIGVVSI